MFPLIINLFTFQLLMKENLDLKLSPYKVLAVNSKRGFVQIIESVGIADVLDKYGSVLAFLQKHGPSETAPLGVDPEVMDNYIKSLGKSRGKMLEKSIEEPDDYSYCVLGYSVEMIIT